MRKHVFYIEGGDNVGKSTTISKLKETGYIDQIVYSRIGFNKYPTPNLTEQINAIVKSMDELDKAYAIDSTINYRDLKNQLIDETIGYMISDMHDSFNPNHSIQFVNKEDTCYICDRGPLSTYLYQYRGRDGLDTLDSMPIMNEKHLLEQFIRSYIPNSPNELNVIILNNNGPLSSIHIDTSETISYKKAYDTNVKLQTRVNNSLNNIVAMIQNNQLNTHINFFYVNIFDANMVRKSASDVCREVIQIINGTGGK